MRALEAARRVVRGVGFEVAPGVRVEFGVEGLEPARSGAAWLSGVLAYLSGRYMEEVIRGEQSPAAWDLSQAIEVVQVVKLLLAYSGPALRVGDFVAWRAAWGTGAPAEAQVTAITVAAEGSAKHGGALREVSWGLLMDPGECRRCVVSLANGHWAYGFQVTPLAVAGATAKFAGGAA